MQIDVACQHTQLTPALSQAITEKFEKIQTHISRPLRAHVVLTIDGDIHRAEGTIRGLGKPLVATVESDNMYTAITSLSQVLDRQWRKRKTTQTQSVRHSATSIKRDQPFG